MQADEGTQVTAPSRLTTGWLVVLAAVIVAGVLLPPVGAVAALVSAAQAHREGRSGLRNGLIALGVVFAVLTAVVGVTLVGTSGGTSTS